MKMYSKLGRLLVLTGLMLSGSSTYAAQQIWVSLGSFTELASAAELRDRASAAFSQLSVVPSESAIGFVYRVVDGPVASHAVAKSKIEQARMLGIFDAWLLVKDDSFAMPAGVSDTELMASASADAMPKANNDRYSASYGLQGSASGAVLDEYSTANADDSSAYSNSSYAETAYSGGGSDETDDYVNLPLGKQELVETAPAGYGLHQLRRSGSMPAGPAVESRLSELKGIGAKQD